MSDTQLRFRLGVFVLSALVLLASLIWLFSSAPSFFKQHHEYVIRFRQAPGLAPGASVRRSGVRVGEVRSVELDDVSGDVTVVIQVEPKYTVRRNDHPTLVQALIGGGASIDLVQDRKAPPCDCVPVEPGEELTGVCQTGVAGLLDKASDVVPSTQNALEDASRVMKRLEQMAPLMEDAIKEYRDLAKTTREAVPKLTGAVDEVTTGARTWNRFGDRLDQLLVANQEKVTKTMENLNETLQRIGSTFNEENQRNLAVTLQNVRDTSGNLDKITKNTDDLMTETRGTVKRINEAVARADEALDNIQDATKPLADRTSSITKNLDEATEKLNLLITDIRDITRTIFSGDGTLKKLATDPSLYNNIDEGVAMLNRLMPRVERILKDAEIFADKLARHPELIGAGGVVQPSLGIKR
jgi:phospholipid/cholesterol/gamma-HCH transport system substrate-binding protein